MKPARKARCNMELHLIKKIIRSASGICRLQYECLKSDPFRSEVSLSTSPIVPYAQEIMFVKWPLLIGSPVT